MCSVVQSGSEAYIDNAKLGFLCLLVLLLGFGGVFFKAHRQGDRKNTDSEILGEEDLVLVFLLLACAVL